MTRLGLLAMVMVLGGCAGYTTYPPEEGQWAGSTPNVLTLEAVMAESLIRVIEDYPPPAANGEPSIAINLPQGLHPIRYERVAEKINESIDYTVAPVTEETVSLPRYSVKTIRTRGSKSEVDVFRPVYESLSGPDSQMITLWLSGGVMPWHVTRTQVHTPGAFEPPAPYFLMTEEAYDAKVEAEKQAAREAKEAEKAAKRAEQEAAKEEEG